jgi:glutaredoxin 3
MEFGFYNSEQNSMKALVDGVIRNSDFNPAIYKKAVNELIKENKMLVFTKSYCPYSRALKKMLDANGLKGQYEVYEIDRQQHGNEIHKMVKEMSGRITIPNVYLNGQNLGGDEEVEKMAADGSLKKLLDVMDMYNTF